MTYEELTAGEPPLHTLIPIEEFKSVLGIDDRDDKLVKFCLDTSTLTIESYCKRKLLRRKHFEKIEYYGDLLLSFSEYPVNEVLSVSIFDTSEILEPDFYNIMPDCNTDIDIPFSILLSRAIQRYKRFSAIKIIYWAGYSSEKSENLLTVPADLKAACLELASWNFNRYKGRRIGMSGNIKGAGIQGEHFELSLPENVKVLLETYIRRMI
jgi:hypothetical protein